MTNAYRYVFAASVTDVPTSGKPIDLGIGQVGVFDGKTWDATSGINAKSILLAQGTLSTLFPQGAGKDNFSLKSDEILGRNLKSLKKIQAKKGQGEVVTIGFDGVDTNKNLTVKQGDSFTFWITLSGTPIANLLGDSPKTHYAVWTEQFTVQLPCVSECVDTCGDVFDPNIVGDAAIAEINKRKIIGGQYLTDYIKVTKLVSCDTPSGLPTVSYTSYTLTIPDAGDYASLGTVQAQYPGVVVKRTNRNGIFSTYELLLLTSEGTPAPFSSEGLPVVPTCDTCPSGCPEGYSLQEALDVWIVSRPLGSNSDLHDTAAQTAFAAAVAGGYTAVQAQEFLSFNGSTAAVKLYVTTGSTETAILADSIVLVGTNVAICTQDTPTTTAWVECKTATKAEQSFVISLLDSCANDYLAELTALYGNTVTLVTANADTCVSQYSVTVESSNIDFDACDDVKWQFKAPAPFKGVKWTEVLGVTGYGEGCNVGLKIESIYEQRKAKECFLTQVAYEFEPLFISASTRNPDPNNYSVLCDSNVPVTKIQGVEYPRGFGRVVVNQLIGSLYQFNLPWYKNPAERDALNYELGVDLEGYYDQFVLEYDVHPDKNGASGTGMTQTQAMEFSVFYPQGTGGAFENAIAAFGANFGVIIEDIG